jgi:uncharacterized protein YjbI with pentapeptide repeats
MIQPQLALVKPRVVPPQGGEAVPLEDAIRPFIEAGRRGVIGIHGPAGSGKTTALRHLATVLPLTPHIQLMDDPPINWPLGGSTGDLIIYASERRDPSPAHLADFDLARWGQDELIEYLLAAHRERCASVIGRLQAAAADGLFADVPEIWRLVLDTMAADETLPNARAALLGYVRTHLADPEAAGQARGYCLAALLGQEEALDGFLQRLRQRGCKADVRRALRHAAVQTLLAAEQIALDLRTEQCAYLAHRLSRGLVQEVAGRVVGNAPALDGLRRVVTEGPAAQQPTAASILHATGTGWVPGSKKPPQLSGAVLDRAVWPGVKLAGVVLDEADLSDADLTRARLYQGRARKTSFRGATLHAATMNAVNAAGADFGGADLSFIEAEKAEFDGANLARANLEGACLRSASLQGVNLTAARLVLADLHGATLSAVELAGADFTRASFGKALLLGVDLRPTRLTGAVFLDASLTHCNFEGMELSGADFENASLLGALMTGSVMPGANFRKACLREAKLAEIAWEGADLRGADLRGATFHMGSTRGGLVGSYLASEGTRTGFYTDDYYDQDFKAPEEIRKANLCGADLRGAHVADVDFYLVDLRGAQYDPEQERHFRHCGAILEERDD